MPLPVPVSLPPPSFHPPLWVVYLPWHLFRFMSVRRIMANHLTSWHVCVTMSVCACDILCPTRSPLVLAVIVGVARLATRRIRNIRLTRARSQFVCLFICLLCLLCLFSCQLLLFLFCDLQLASTATSTLIHTAIQSDSQLIHSARMRFVIALSKCFAYMIRTHIIHKYT